jgi:hypothetical protein
MAGLRASIIVCITAFLLGTVSAQLSVLTRLHSHRRPLHALDSRLPHALEVARDRRSPLVRRGLLRRPRAPEHDPRTGPGRRRRRGRRHDAVVPARRPRGQSHVRQRERLCVPVHVAAPKNHADAPSIP